MRAVPQGGGKVMVQSREAVRNEMDYAKHRNEHYRFGTEIVWRNVFTMTLLHTLGIYGWIISIFHAKWQSFVWLYVVGNMGGLGIQAGSHRLWTHRSYKAHWSLRVLLMLWQTIALQDDIYQWVRDHRTHHKYSETDADPHNSKRGFFFAHVGWLLVRKHEQVKSKGSQIDLSDVWADPVVRFQRKFYIPLVLLLWGLFPVLVPVYGWGESVWCVVFGNFFRYVVSLHQSWLVNSAAHLSGAQHYDRALQPRENYFVTYVAMGEGYHNYHHAFPWDYSASEFAATDCFNYGTAFINLAAALGLATKLRVASKQTIEKRIMRTGDHSLLSHRKPTNPVAENVKGMLITTWMLWFSLGLRAIFFTGYDLLYV